MAGSNYPNGFKNGVVIRGIPLVQTHPGKVFWVDNSTTGLLAGQVGGSNGNDGTFNAPFATIDYAVGQCRANKGDVIFVKPGHAETISSATTLAVDVAGIAIVGLGQGSNRPTLNFTATTSNIAVSAANVLMYNLLLTGGVDAVVAVMTVSAADVKLIDIEYRDVTGQAVDTILTTAGATRIEIDGFVHRGDSAAGGASAIAIVGVTNPKITNFDLQGNYSVAAIDFRTTASVEAIVEKGYIWNQLDAAAVVGIIDTITGSTGRMGPSIMISLGVDSTSNTTNITEAITGATWRYFGAGNTAGLNGASILVCNLDGEAAMTQNVVQSTDA